MVDSEQSIVSTYQYGGGDPSVATYHAHAEVVVAHPTASAVVDHGALSDVDVIRQFLREDGVEERHLTDRWVELRVYVRGKFF